MLASGQGNRYSISTRIGTSSHYGNIHKWEVWNEPNDTCVTESLLDAGYNGFWRRPTRRDYLTGFDSLPGMCKLYMRMAYLADSVIKHTSGHTDDKVVLGGTCCVLDSNPDWLVSGARWVGMCYQVAAENNWGVFWDAVGVHPYQDDRRFVAEHLEDDADTLHAIMRNHRDAGRELWDTEMGWNPRPEDQIPQDTYACHLAKTYVLSAACLGRPEGGFNKTCWWFFWRQPDWWAWGLVESNLTKQDAFYAFRQARSKLTGKRLNGRVMTEDAGDSHVRLYEFEDPTSLKKTWVCWSNGEGEGGIPVVGLPVRSDTTYVESLAYNNTPPSNDTTAAATGWLCPSLYSRPAFITEKTAVSRPELVAESLWLSPLWSGLPCIETVHVRIKNRDSQRRTPIGCATWVRLTWNDSIVDSTYYADTIGRGQTVVVSYVWNLPPAFHGDGLLAANVNPGMRYVEREGTDDNQAYQGSSLGTW